MLWSVIHCTVTQYNRLSETCVLTLITESCQVFNEFGAQFLSPTWLTMRHFSWISFVTISTSPLALVGQNDLGSSDSLDLETTKWVQFKRWSSQRFRIGNMRNIDYSLSVSCLIYFLPSMKEDSHFIIEYSHHKPKLQVFFSGLASTLFVLTRCKQTCCTTLVILCCHVTGASWGNI